MTDPHVELPHSRRPIAHGARRVRDIDPHTHVEVTLMLKAPPLPATARLPVKALSAADLARQYGASAHDIRKVEDVLRGFGLRVEGLGASRRSMRVSGTAHAIDAAFKANVAIYHSADHGDFRGREDARLGACRNRRTCAQRTGPGSAAHGAPGGHPAGERGDHGPATAGRSRAAL